MLNRNEDLILQPEDRTLYTHVVVMTTKVTHVLARVQTPDGQETWKGGCHHVIPGRTRISHRREVKCKDCLDRMVKLEEHAQTQASKPAEMKPSNPVQSFAERGLSKLSGLMDKVVEVATGGTAAPRPETTQTAPSADNSKPQSSVPKPNFLISYGVGGSINTRHTEKLHFDTEEEAVQYAFAQACEEYEQYTHATRRRPVSEIMEDDGVDEEVAEEVYAQERESWLRYDAEPVK